MRRNEERRVSQVSLSPRLRGSHSSMVATDQQHRHRSGRTFYIWLLRTRNVLIFKFVSAQKCCKQKWPAAGR